MITFRAHFDGAVLVPDEPVDLPMGRQIEVSVRDPLDQADPSESPDLPLLRLALALAQHPLNPDRPVDFAAQHDHYLYGRPKRR